MKLLAMYIFDFYYIVLTFITLKHGNLIFKIVNMSLNYSRHNNWIKVETIKYESICICSRIINYNKPRKIHSKSIYVREYWAYDAWIMSRYINLWFMKISLAEQYIVSLYVFKYRILYILPDEDSYEDNVTCQCKVKFWLQVKFHI